VEDRQIWDHARTHGFAIVSKDTDFRERSYVEETLSRQTGPQRFVSVALVVCAPAAFHNTLIA
jgi:predicted nuclease of predicted toxin-antitoxin system